MRTLFIGTPLNKTIGATITTRISTTMGIAGLALTLVAALAAAQPAPQAAPESAAKASKTFTSAAGITALIAKAKAERKPGEPTVTEPILELGSYDGHLEYRAAVGNAAVH